MRTIHKLPVMEARTVTLLVGFAVGIGIVVHKLFFVIALGIMLVAIVQWTAQRIQEYLREFRMFHRYP